MKKIIYSDLTGTVFVVHPAEGGRLCNSVILNGTVYSEGHPVPVDTFFRGWPVTGGIADWAETEDEYVARIKVKDVPTDAINPQIVDPSIIPSDRSKRMAWRQSGATIVLDPTISAQIDVTVARSAADESDRLGCKLDGPIMSLINNTRAEWRTWTGTNFPSLTVAEKNKLGDLFWVVSLGVRKEVRK